MKKLMFGLGISVLLLAALEAGAWGVEAALGPIDAATPMPSPAAAKCGADCLDGVASARQDYPSGIPMGFGGGTTPKVFDQKYGLNSLGLRGPELGERSAERRLMTLGDSTVFGFEVAPDDIFSSVAARALSESWGVPVSPQVGAQPGHTIDQSWDVLTRVGPQVDPDVLIVANQWSDLFHDGSGTRIETPGQAAPSALYRLVHRGLAPWLEPRVIGWVDPSTGRGMPAVGVEPRTPADRYIERLGQIAGWAQDRGAQPVFVVLPAPIDLDPAGPPAVIETYRGHLSAVASERGALLIDCAAWFVENGATTADFYDSVHPSRSGHAQLGACVGEGLVRGLPAP